ncbi:MAG: flagellar brake protein [Clostridium sp.]|nr:flagellar brake protein [Clostridium sp.]
MRFDKLKIGQKLEIQLYKTKDTRVDVILVSQFEWVEKGDVLCIAAPIYRGRLYPVNPGTKMDVVFIYRDNLYGFEAEVTNRGIKQKINLLKLKPLTGIRKIQRREFFRFECAVPIYYREIKDPRHIKRDEEGKLIKTYTGDLGGGGVCIRLKEKIEYGSYVECELLLNDLNKVSFIGRVVRLTQYDFTCGEYKYEIGVQFEKISGKDRERIISFIFQEQRKLIKKG